MPEPEGIHFETAWDEQDEAAEELAEHAFEHYAAAPRYHRSHSRNAFLLLLAAGLLIAAWHFFAG